MGRLSNRLKATGTGSRLAVDLAPRHAFYDWCNEVLAEAEFDEAVEMLCQPYYQDGIGSPSIPPGRYFRMLFVGQFRAWSRSAKSPGGALIPCRCIALCAWRKARRCPTTQR
jgi:hypothetical protein